MSLWNIEETKSAVNHSLGEFFAVQKTAAQALDDDYYRLWAATEQFVMSGGKRLRPYLCILAYQAFGGRNPEEIISVATAQELLHLSLLIHDDIIDRDYIRYGVDNIAGYYRRVYESTDVPAATTNHLASGAALLAGDLLLSSAYGLVHDSKLPQGKILIAQKYLQQAMFHVAGGELLDTEAVLLEIPKVNTTKIMELKTAQYSFIAPLLTGASLAGTSKGSLAKLIEYGTRLGIGFQLADDILGVYGDEAAIGKSASGDLKEAKRTLLLQLTLQKADPQSKKYLLQTLGARNVTTKDITKVRKLMIETGALVAVQKLANTYADQAAKIANELSVTPEAKVQFIALTKKVIDTTHRSIASFNS